MIKAPRIEALALAAQAFIYGVRAIARRRSPRSGGPRAILPDDAEVLAATWGQDRVVASLFRDDIRQAVRESSTAIDDLSGPHSRRPAGHGRCTPCCRRPPARTGSSARSALGRPARPSAGTRPGSRTRRRYSRDGQAMAAGQPRWRPRARSSSGRTRRGGITWPGGWSSPTRSRTPGAAPAAWMRDATREFDANGQHKLASACRVVLRQAGERAPRTGRGKAQVPAQMRRLRRDKPGDGRVPAAR